jgi:hypothetical protein
LTEDALEPIDRDVPTIWWFAMERLPPDTTAQLGPRCGRLKASEPAKADVANNDTTPATDKATILRMRVFFM